MNDRMVTDETVGFNGETPIGLVPHWDESSRDSLVAALDALAADDRLEWVRNDQMHRWRTGKRVPIEAYLNLAPLSGAGSDLSIDLIYSEYILRQELGESPPPDEYLRRFPEHEAALRRLFAVDSAIMTMDDPRGAAPSPYPVASTSSLPTIGKYVILDKIAEGGQGIVFRAVHPQLSREVAIKWSKEKSQSDRSRGQLLAEGKMLARIEHPRMVRVFDLDFHEDRPYLVMELASGSTLEAYRDRVRPTADQAAALAIQIARAVDVLHQQGITHRDLKPKNILIENDGEPKIVDFGLATCRHGYDTTEAADHVSGTLAYIPPEQANVEDAKIGPRSDVYALGGVLHFLLTGKPPRQAPDMRRMFDAAGRGEWDASSLESSSVPKRLRDVVKKALSAEPGARHASAAEFANELERWRGGTKRRHRLLLAGAAVVVCAIAIAWYATRPVSQPIVPVNNGDKASAPIAPVKLEAEVFRTSKGKALHLQDAAPVMTGNLLRFTMTLPANRHGAMLFYSEGKWTLAESYEAEPTARSVTFPKEPGSRIPLGGEPGTEVFVFCASGKGPIDVREVERQTAKLGEFPVLNDQALLTFDDAGVKKWDRGTLGGAIKGQSPEDIAFAKLDAIQIALRKIADVHGGVLFVHRSEE